MDCSMPCSPVLHYLPEFPQTHSIESVMPSNHLILCSSFLLMPLLFLCIRVFSNESVLCIRWPKYWSFSFSISPSNEDSGLISLRIGSFDLLAVQGTFKSLLQSLCVIDLFISYSFELWYWKRLLRVPWTTRTSNQSVLMKSTLNLHWKD